MNAVLSKPRNSLLHVALVTIFTVIIALPLGAGFWRASFFFVGFCLAAIYNLSIVNEKNIGFRDSVFWILFVSVFMTSLIHKIFGVQLYFIIELLIYSLFPVLLLYGYRLYTEVPMMRWVLLLLILFLLLSVLSSVAGRSHWLSSVFQFFTNLKMFLLLLMGYLLAWSPRTEDMFWRLVKWLWLPIMLMVAWQWMEPRSYFLLFGNADPGTLDPQGFVPTKGLGPFQHASYLAMYAGILLLASGIKQFSEKTTGYTLPIIAYGILLISSAERAELVIAITLLVMAFLLIKNSRYLALSIVILTIAIPVIGFVFWLFMGDSLSKELLVWGFVGNEDVQHPRPVMYLFAKYLANYYFPLGSGLGTFAGAGAAKFDYSLYYDLGFARFDWFLSKNVLSDTYWPNFLAETGWFGILLMACIILILVAYSFKKVLNVTDSTVKTYWTIALSGLLFEALLGFTSPAFQDPGLSLLPLIFFGIAHRRTQHMVSS